MKQFNFKTKLCNLTRFATLCLAFVLCTSAIYAQNTKVSGTVVDKSSGDPMIGAAVTIEGTTLGVVTGADGTFELAGAPVNSNINVTYVGYKDYSTPVVAGKTYKILLAEDLQSLEEVIVIGYETKKKSVVTGAISSVNADDLNQAKAGNAINAMTGRISGVNVISNSGQPGTSPLLYIRGVGTNGDSTPLYVIDGLQMDNMDNINPNDIESMEVLKDATSAAIYGARAANGVVLVTTKKGVKGKTTLTYDGYYGISSAQNLPDMMNAEEYVEMVNEFATNNGTGTTMTTNGTDTNWLEAIFQDAPVQEHNVTMTTGSEKGSSLLSLGFLDQEGIIGGDKSSFRRFTFRSNNEYNVNDFIKVGANANIAYRQKVGMSTGANGWNPVTYAYNMDPLTEVYDSENGDEQGYGITETGYAKNLNPVAFINAQPSVNGRNVYVYGNVFAEIKLYEDLYFKTDAGTNIGNGYSRSYQQTYYHSADLYNDTSKLTQNASTSFGWQWENTLRYKKSFGDHNFSVLLGMSARESTSEWMSASRSDLSDEAELKETYRYLDSGDISTATNSSEASAVHSMASYFGRLSYDYKERYMAELVVRRDGSSNFGPDNQYAVFPGVSAGWNVNNEEFWDVNNFETLKIRASWGQNGNENIDGFSYTSIVNNTSYYTFGDTPTITIGSAPNSLVNPDVKWETSEQTNIGADMGFFGGKLTATVDWYKKTTKDLLLQPTLSNVYGNDSPYYNLGQISNSGIEIQATYRGNFGDLNYSISANASYLHNVVDKVGNTNGYEDGGKWREVTNVTRMEEGYAMGYYRLYQTDGIFQSEAEVAAYTNSDGEMIQPNAVPGDFKWVDVNGDGTITEDDRTDCGNPWAKWTYGANIGLNWKGIDFTLFLTAKTGFKVYAAQYREEGFGLMNLPTYYLDYWTPETGGDTVPRLASGTADVNGNLSNPSDFYLFDGDYLKIGLIELGYSLPKKLISKAKLSNVRFYVAMDNAATFSAYPFMDSETSDMRGTDSILETGMDYSSYPVARTTRVGVNIAF